jgi:hypothetical protein
MEAVFEVKCQLGKGPCDTIGSSDKQDSHNTRDLRSLSTRLENKASTALYRNRDVNIAKNLFFGRSENGKKTFFLNATI